MFERITRLITLEEMITNINMLREYIALLSLLRLLRYNLNNSIITAISLLLQHRQDSYFKDLKKTRQLH